MNDRNARCLVYVAPGKAELQEVAAELDGASKEPVELRALWSGISRGTERLVHAGLVPASEYQRMRAPFQRGDFPFPVGYGYAWIGESDDGETYFGLFPHQNRVVAPKSALTVLPDDVPPRRAVLAANMETALNIVWDSGVGPADRVIVVGGGVLGLLVAGVVSGIPGTTVTVVDTNADRREITHAMGAGFSVPEEAEGEADLVIHASASEAGLTTALSLAGTEAVVVEASWFGSAAPAVPLGGAFHSKRLTLRSSQVGMVSPARRPRWSHSRRLGAALGLLADPKYDALITREVAFGALPVALADILEPRAAGLATAVSYL